MKYKLLRVVLAAVSTLGLGAAGSAQAGHPEVSVQLSWGIPLYHAYHYGYAPVIIAPHPWSYTRHHVHGPACGHPYAYNHHKGHGYRAGYRHGWRHAQLHDGSSEGRHHGRHDRGDD